MMNARPQVGGEGIADAARIDDARLTDGTLGRPVVRSLRISGATRLHVGADLGRRGVIDIAPLP